MRLTIYGWLLACLSVSTAVAQPLDCSQLVGGTYSLCDQFTDANLTDNPTWQGNDSQFLVNASAQLQLNSTGTDTSYLATAAAMGSEWRWDLKMTFAPSDNNKARIYLAANQSNLEQPLNGYFLDLGENGSVDPIKLYRQDANTLNLLATGSPATLANNPDIHLKINRSATGDWQVYLGSADASTWVLDLQATDNTYTSSSFAGVWCKYTSSNANKFFFDNTYIGDPIVDSTPPQVTTLTVLDDTHLEVCFSELVGSLFGENTENYVLNGATQPINAVTNATETCFTLTFANSLPQGDNTLLISNMADLTNNVLPPFTATFSIYTPAAGDVVINEILADPDPAVALPAYEFVELHNTQNVSIALEGWHLTDDFPDTGGTLTGGSLPPNGYVVLCATGAAQAAFEAALGSNALVVGVSSFPSLTNSGKTLTLTDPNGNFIDQVSYSITWYNDAIKDDGGWTLERINPTINCSGSANWAASNNPNGGTPAAQNSVYLQPTDTTAPALTATNLVAPDTISISFDEELLAVNLLPANFSISNGISINSVADMGNGALLLVLNAPLQAGIIYQINIATAADCLGNTATNLSTQVAIPQAAAPFDVLITEIFADPEPPAEYDLPNLALVRKKFIELYNRSNKIISLQNWQLSDASDTTYLPTFVLFPQQYIIVCSSSNTAAFAAQGATALGTAGFTDPNTTSDNLLLADPNGNIISQVAYDNTWYRDAIKAQGGWTLEMIDTNNPCAGAYNWRASVASIGGTPNAPNSVAATNPDTSLPDLLHAEAVSPTTVQVFWSEPLSRTTNPSDYTIDNGVVVTAANALPTAYNSVLLTLANPLSPNTIYTLTVANQTDCVGNAVGMHNTAQLGIAQTAAAGELIINEILFNPATGGYDFVELYNNSNKVIDLGGWFFANAELDENPDSLLNQTPVVTQRYSILPQQYLAFTSNPDWVRTYYSRCNTIAFNGIIAADLPSYADDEGVVAITDLFGGNRLDMVHYYDDWQNPLLNDDNGVSLERISPTAPAAQADSWQSAAATQCFGTPGLANSQLYQASGATTDGITISPEIFSPNGDAHDDFTQINYQFDAAGYQVSATIYDERGRTIRQLLRNETASDKGFWVWDGTTDDQAKAPIGIYVVLVSVFDLQGNTQKYKKAVTLTANW